MKRFLLPMVVVLLLVIGLSWWYWTNIASPAFYKTPGQVSVSNYDECVAAGFPVMESYPSQCRTSDGQTFTQTIGNELELQDQVRLENPRPNQLVSSPISITGEAIGPWFFEASFSARIEDDSGQELGIGIITAEGEWMTEQFVNFSGTIEFDAPSTTTGWLILEKANPSGLPEHDQTLVLPVRFN